MNLRIIKWKQFFCCKISITFHFRYLYIFEVQKKRKKQNYVIFFSFKFFFNGSFFPDYALRFGVWLKNKCTQRSNETTLKFLFTANKPWNQWKLSVSKYDDLIALLQENHIEVYHEVTNLLWRVEIKTEFVKVCNIFFSRQNDMLVYTNDNGNIYFFDVNDGTELLKYIEVRNIELTTCSVYFIRYRALWK